MSELAAISEKKRQLIRQILQCWTAVIKNEHLYSSAHSVFVQSVQTFLSVIQEYLSDQMEVTVKNMDGLYFIDDKLFAEESLTFLPLLKIMEQAKLESVTFLSGLTVDELKELVTALNKFDVAAHDLFSFSSAHIRTISVSIEETHSTKSRLGPRLSSSILSFDELESRFREVVGHLLEDQTYASAQFLPVLDDFLDNLARDPALFAFLVAARPAQDIHLDHALNSLTISCFIGQQLNLNPSVTKILALCALFHDVGRWLLPPEFNAHYRLPPGAEEIVRGHARAGALLLASVPDLPLLVSRVALEHHWGQDHQGYPAFPSSFRPHFFSQIVELADFLSWRTLSDRWYHRPVPLYRALKAAIRRSGSQFEPILVKIVFPFFGFYPPGTRVLLSDGTMGVSLIPDLTNPLRPGVAIRSGDKATWDSLTRWDAGRNSFARSITVARGSSDSVWNERELIPSLEP